jgi:hypothetical protein
MLPDHTEIVLRATIFAQAQVRLNMRDVENSVVPRTQIITQHEIFH